MYIAKLFRTNRYIFTCFEISRSVRSFFVVVLYIWYLFCLYLVGDDVGSSYHTV